MRRPVAAVEARRSRSPDVADHVAVMEGWVGKEGGAESLVGTIRGSLCGFPLGRIWRLDRVGRIASARHPSGFAPSASFSSNTSLISVTGS
jgi:hypothetical protein